MLTTVYSLFSPFRPLYISENPQHHRQLKYAQAHAYRTPAARGACFLFKPNTINPFTGNKTSQKHTETNSDTAVPLHIDIRILTHNGSRAAKKNRRAADSHDKQQIGCSLKTEQNPYLYVISRTNNQLQL